MKVLKDELRLLIVIKKDGENQMFNEIKESDWKYLRKLKPMLLERACSRINEEAKLILNNENNLNQYELYITLYKHFEKKDEMIAVCFNDHKRSKAKEKILNLLYYEIITDEEFQDFSDETREFLNRVRNIK